MGNVNYELPDHIGTLSLTVPSHWVGARAEGVEALWIDQHASGFKENVTLKIRAVAKADDAEKLLDQYVEKLQSSTGLTPVKPVEKTPGRRLFSVDTSIEEHLLRQDQAILYAETDTQSYLVILSSTHLRVSERVDISTAEIVSE